MDFSGIIEQVVAALSLGGLYSVMALGVALVFGIMRLINFAYGELIMLGAYVLAWDAIGGAVWPLAVLAVIGLVVVAAVAQERIAFRPIRGASPATLMVTSFALSYFLQSGASLVTGGKTEGAVSPLGSLGVYVVGDVRIPQLEVVTIVVSGVLLGSLVLFLQRTPLGIEMRASAHDFDMARLLGVRANRVIAAAFAISGIFAGAVAILLTARTGSVTPTLGVAPLLIAFVATVLGGLGSLTGAALGACVLAFLTVGVQAALPAGVTPFRDAISFGALLLVLLIRPDGLVPRR